MGINIIYDKSPIILAIIHVKTRTKVTVVFFTFLVSSVTKVLIKPLFLITPIPKRIIIKCGRTARLAKLDTVLVNIYLRPLKFNKDVTASVVA